MTSFQCISTVVACSIAFLLGSCATKAPAPPPIVSLGERPCVTEPNLAGATPLMLSDDKPVKVTLDGGASCWQPAGQARSVYVVFSLPPTSGESYLLSIRSEPLGEGLFAPRVYLLDEKGATIRKIPRDDFMFHGASLYVGVRVHAGEAYVIVASDPGSIGKQVSQINGRVTVQSTVAGAAFFNIYKGSESTSTYTYALNGMVSVAAKPMPKAN